MATWGLTGWMREILPVVSHPGCQFRNSASVRRRSTRGPGSFTRRRGSGLSRRRTCPVPGGGLPLNSQLQASPSPLPQGYSAYRIMEVCKSEPAAFTQYDTDVNSDEIWLLQLWSGAFGGVISAAAAAVVAVGVLYFSNKHQTKLS